MNNLTPQTASSPDGAALHSPGPIGNICADPLFGPIAEALDNASSVIEAVWPGCPKDTPFAEIIARANQQREDAARTDLY